MALLHHNLDGVGGGGGLLSDSVRESEDQQGLNRCTTLPVGSAAGFRCSSDITADFYQDRMGDLADDPSSFESLIRGISDESLMMNLDVAGDGSLAGLDSDVLNSLGNGLGHIPPNASLSSLLSPSGSNPTLQQQQQLGVNGYGICDPQSTASQVGNGPEIKDPQALVVLHSLLGKLEQQQQQKASVAAVSDVESLISSLAANQTQATPTVMSGMGHVSSANPFSSLSSTGFGTVPTPPPTTPGLSPPGSALSQSFGGLQSPGLTSPSFQQSPAAASQQDLFLQQLLQLQQPPALPPLPPGASAQDIVDSLDRQLSAQAAVQANTLNMLAKLKQQATQISSQSPLVQDPASLGLASPQLAQVPMMDSGMAAMPNTAPRQPLSPTSASSPNPSNQGSTSSGVSSLSGSSNTPSPHPPPATITAADVFPDVSDVNERPSVKTKGKSVRKTSHNKIEKKYRRSINDRIQQLQRRFSATGGGKTLPKSGVLQKVLEYLDQVDHENNILKQTNEALRHSHNMALTQLTTLQCQLGQPAAASHHAAMVSKEVGEQIRLEEDTIPSPISSSSSGIGTDVGAFSPQSLTDMKSSMKSLPSEPPIAVSSSRGMPESSKPLYCLVLVFFVTLVASPLDFFGVSTGGDVGHAGGRTLLRFLGVDNEYESPLYAITGYVLQVIIMLLGLSWVLIHGEPFIGPNSSESVKFRRHRLQADAYLAKANYEPAILQLEAGLHAIGRRLPLSRANLYFSLVWQIMNCLLLLTGVSQLVHWVVSVLRFVLRLEGRAVSGELRTVTSKMASQAARVYHQLHGLSLTGQASYKPAMSLYIALCSFNLAKNAGSALDRSELAEIYATVAVGLRAVIPSYIPLWPITRLLLRRARSVCHPPPPLLSCLLHPDSVKFMDTTTSSSAGNVLWSQPTTPGRPLTAVSRKLRQHLFRHTLYQLLVAHHQQAKSDPSALRLGAVYDVLPPHTVATIKGNLSMMRQLCRIAPSTSRKTTLSAADSDVDVVSLWWLDVITVGVHWLASQDSEASELYATIMQQPKTLSDSSDPLPQAVYSCFIARKALMCGAKEPRLLELCGQASIPLAATINQNRSFEPSTDVVPSTHQLMQLLCCDWLLSTRVGMWHANNQCPGSSQAPHPANRGALSAFTRDLSSLQKLSHSCPIGLSQVYVYEAASRFMAGANPLRSRFLLAKGNKLCDPVA